ncbi:hypothetical protein F5Y14DRAFT_276203 [Nemania sp. NC0429]|nr:hypothetical protein F5Y14DRAFT_276203 [Nemania sp. NC0429]
MVIHPLTFALVLLVLVATALPCFVPPIVSVALSWLATAISIAAVVCTFSLVRRAQSRARSSRHMFSVGIGRCVLLVGAFGVWVFTVLLTTAWWLRRRSDRRNLDEYVGEPSSAHRLPNEGSCVESRLGEFPGEAAPKGKELPEGKNAHRHELLNTDKREQGRAESGAQERYELGTPGRS